MIESRLCTYGCWAAACRTCGSSSLDSDDSDSVSESLAKNLPLIISKLSNQLHNKQYFGSKNNVHVVPTQQAIERNGVAALRELYLTANAPSVTSQYIVMSQ